MTSNVSSGRSESATVRTSGKERMCSISAAASRGGRVSTMEDSEERAATAGEEEAGELKMSCCDCNCDG